jgi:hypothetical protein
MHIPQARDEKLACSVDDYGFSWDMCLSPLTNRNDAIAICDHSHVRLGDTASGVNHCHAFDHKRLRPGAGAEQSEYENQMQAASCGTSRQKP